MMRTGVGLRVTPEPGGDIAERLSTTWITTLHFSVAAHLRLRLPGALSDRRAAALHHGRSAQARPRVERSADRAHHRACVLLDLCALRDTGRQALRPEKSRRDHRPGDGVLERLYRSRSALPSSFRHAVVRNIIAGGTLQRCVRARDGHADRRLAHRSLWAVPRSAGGHCPAEQLLPRAHPCRPSLLGRSRCPKLRVRRHPVLHQRPGPRSRQLPRRRTTCDRSDEQNQKREPPFDDSRFSSARALGCVQSVARGDTPRGATGILVPIEVRVA